MQNQFNRKFQQLALALYGILKIVQVHNAVSHIASPRADSVFVGQCLSVGHCPPANELYRLSESL